MENHKRCSRCGETLPHTDYYQRRNGTPFQPCKRCTCARVATYRLAHPEKVKAQKLADGKAHAEQYRQRAARWLADNAERARRTKAAYRHRERERLAAYQREYARRFPDRAKAAIKGAMAKRPGYYRLRARLASARYNARLKQATILPITPRQIEDKVRYWGGRCWVCLGQFQALDHYKPLAKGGPHVVANLRPICQVCNSRKADHWPITQEDLLRWSQPLSARRLARRSA